MAVLGSLRGKLPERSSGFGCRVNCTEVAEEVEQFAALFLVDQFRLGRRLGAHPVVAQHQVPESVDLILPEKVE